MPTHTLPSLIDSHVHTDSMRFAADIDAVMHSARSQNIVAQVVPATTAELWPRLQQFCDEYDDCHACFGLHPCFMDQHSDEHLLELSRLLGRERPVAVGECGLDYAIANANATSERIAQQALFAAQLALAREFNLPIVIHAVRAVEDVIRMIRAAGHHNGLVHSFNGSLQQAHRLIDLGYSLSFGGAVSYSRASRLQQLIKDLPLDAILLETDAPDQPGMQHHGQRNEPARLVDVWHNISELRDESATTVARTTTQNAIRLFSLPVSA